VASLIKSFPPLSSKMYKFSSLISHPGEEVSREVCDIQIENTKTWLP
jgi:hypothetical protein